MALKSFAGKFLATSVLLTASAVGTYGYAVKKRISLAELKDIEEFDDIPESFRQSRSVRQVVNFRNRPTVCDSRFTAIDLPARWKDVSDEFLLAKFTEGYFGGLVIAPERIGLQIVKPNWVHFDALERPAPIWSRAAFSKETLPPLHAIFFGTFQVSDKHLKPSKDEAASTGETQSYVDFAFGDDRSRFAGVHRFAVVRKQEPEASDRGTVQVQIHAQSMCCNPINDKPLGPDWMFSFHTMYAMLLFRDGISHMKRFFSEG